MKDDALITLEDKSKRMAAMLGLFMPIVNTIAEDFDLEHARQMLHEMEGNAARYDTISILKTNGWQKHEADKIRLITQRMRAIIQLVDSTRRLRECAEATEKSKDADRQIMNIFGL